MPQVGFYHLSQSSLEKALGQLLARTLDAGERAVVRCHDTAQLRSLNAALWKLENIPWLPHGSASQGHAERQPIWLTTGDDLPNDARFLFVTARACTTELEHYQRVFVLFDANQSEELDWARQQWRTWQGSEDFVLSYWQETPSGWTRPDKNDPEKE